MSDKRFKGEQNRKNREGAPGVPWQAFIVSSNESTGMIPAIFSDEMMDSYGSIYEGMNTFPDMDDDKRNIEKLKQ